jgi:hypothetical protein
VLVTNLFGVVYKRSVSEVCKFGLMLMLKGRDKYRSVEVTYR